MSGKKILVADDDKVTLKTLGAQLRGVGFQVVTAMDAIALGAVEFLAKPVDFARLRGTWDRVLAPPPEQK
jgi:ActR/RegA family two-component response regulator